MQLDPGLVFEKAGRFDEAALYFHRGLRGWKEFYIPFLWGEVGNAPGKYTEYAQLLEEYADRLKTCLDKAKLSDERLARMYDINELWMSELLEQEEGEVRTESRKRAVEAEKRGDFRLAADLRACDARFCKVVLAPYQQRLAEECQKKRQTAQAKLHQEAAKAYERRGAEQELLSKGDKALMAIPGLGGPNPWTEITIGRLYPMAIPGAYARVLTPKGEWKGKEPSEVTGILKEKGLKHAEENARVSAVTALANLGQKQAVVEALNDSSALVRQVAARALAAMPWADGWAACHAHSDAEVKAAVAPLLAPAGKELLERTLVITELLQGLGSSSDKTKVFCQSALEAVTGKRLKEKEWADWWRGLGHPKPGLVRTGPDVPRELDLTVDFGAWWQSGHGCIQNLPNPLLKYKFPAKVQWQGYLAVSQAGDHRFYVRNTGQSIRAGGRVVTPDRVGFPGLHFVKPRAALSIDGKTIIPDASNKDVMEDPSSGRLDFSQPVPLEAGLHAIQLEFDIDSYDDIARASNAGIVGGQPCIRLYWSSEHFLRQVIPADRLVSKDSDAK
jgi:hypothetical protein